MNDESGMMNLMNHVQKSNGFIHSSLLFILLYSHAAGSCVAI